MKKTILLFLFVFIAGHNLYAQTESFTHFYNQKNKTIVSLDNDTSVVYVDRESDSATELIEMNGLLCELEILPIGDTLINCITKEAFFEKYPDLEKGIKKEVTGTIEFTVIDSAVNEEMKKFNEETDRSGAYYFDYAFMEYKNKGMIQTENKDTIEFEVSVYGHIRHPKILEAWYFPESKKWYFNIKFEAKSESFLSMLETWILEQ